MKALPERLAFDPLEHERELLPILEGVVAGPGLDRAGLDRLLKKHPKGGSGLFSKAQLIQGLKAFAPRFGGEENVRALVSTLTMKPVRSQSGVAVVTVLTKPYPCPGRCIFCPSDVRMPKSYLSDEPGAQRAAAHRFDPYRQTRYRLRALSNTGHPLDKVELIILGGTWSSYPRGYQRWFIKRCFDALNDFDGEGSPGWGPDPEPRGFDYSRATEKVDGRAPERSYNQTVRAIEKRHVEGASKLPDEIASWSEVVTAHRRNEGAAARCVGLSLETRPDRVGGDEVRRLRRLGCTKVQIGVQSLSDRVLALNRRGHGVASIRNSFRRLRRAGFKIQAHWMPNLYGSRPRGDREDFDRLFGDPDLRPDELKIYPCSLIESAELMAFHDRGQWRPYDDAELLEVVVHALAGTPSYCRLSRVIRDIPGGDIVTGNRTTNFRQVVEAELARRGIEMKEIRCREIRSKGANPGDLRLESVVYEAAGGTEIFLQRTGREGRLAAFLRLFLPPSSPAEEASAVPPEIRDSAIIREVHVYGRVAPLSGADESAPRAQHRGLGRALVAEARRLASRGGFRDLAVISAVGTRDYYRGLGFRDGELYQHLSIEAGGTKAGMGRMAVPRPVSGPA